MGLLFTPLILFLAFNFRTVWSYLLIFILICFLLAIQAPSAISHIIVLIPYILLNLRGNFKKSLGITLALVLPFLLIFPWIFNQLLAAFKNLLTPAAIDLLPVASVDLEIRNAASPSSHAATLTALPWIV